MIGVEHREPHDEKTPEEVIALITSQLNGVISPRAVAARIIEALVYKAHFEQAEGALRWLSSNNEEQTVLERIGL